MKSQRTLLITNINVDWGKFDGYPYDDNGGHPDGNLLLPSTPLDESDPGVAEALAAGAGRMVDAFYYDDAADVNEHLHIRRLLTAEHMAEQEGIVIDSDEFVDKLPRLVYTALAANEDRIGGWAGYGDEVFVIIW